VTWRGVEYDGKHPSLVSAETFEQVQAVLVAHRLSGERSYKHRHYLAGSVFCGRCESRLLFGVTTGSKGMRYEYFFCAGRQSGRTGCELPYLPLEQVDAAVERQWRSESFPQALVQRLEVELLEDLRNYTQQTAGE
jgi:hypothetical protein